MPITDPHSTINPDHKDNGNPVYTSDDPMMPKPPRPQMKSNNAEPILDAPPRKRIFITKEKQR
jgi:hypothetical protein